MEGYLQDLRYAGRMLVSSPGFTLVAVLSLALGIGANVAIFTLVNAVFLRPVPVESPESLVSVYTTHPDYPGLIESNYLNLQDLAAEREVFEGLAATMPVTLTLTGGGSPERLAGELVSARYFDLLGLRPARGRAFLPEEEKLGAAPVVVLSHGLWQRRFGSDPALVGRTLTLNGQQFSVVGVAPPGFRGTSLFASRDLWVPMGVRRQVASPPVVDWFEERTGLMVNAVARLRPGVSPTQAEAAARTVARRLEQQYPDTNKGRSVALVPLVQSTIHPNGRQRVVVVGWFLSVMVGLVLTLAAANVANLLLFRALGRRREIATRVSLGAGRGRLIRQLLTESVLLALLGGAAGLALASWGRSILWALRPPSLPDVLDLSFDPRVLAFALGVSLLTGLLFGLVPALQTSRVDLTTSLKDTAAATTGRRSRALNLLVVAQVALSAVLLIGTGLFTRSLQQALSIDPGFAAGELLSLSFDLSAAGYDTPRALDFLRRATETAAALPGARSAAVGINPPLTIGRGGRVYDPGRQSGTPDEALAVRTDGVSPGYFQTAGIPLVRGRGFADTDREDGPFIVVVNQSLADRVFPGADPVGRRLGFVGADEPATVVGVVRDAKYGTLGEEPQPFVYFALPQAFGGETTLYVRAAGDPAALLDDTRRAVQALDPNLPLVQVRPVADVIDQSLWAPRAGASLLGFFGLLGLVLAAVGVYGVMSYSVDQRRREIGIRMALGEPRRGIVSRVLRRGLGLLIAGLLLGLAAALASARWIAGFLYGVSAHDPVAFATAALVLAAAALLAMLVPARRATTVEPVTVLRSE